METFKYIRVQCYTQAVGPHNSCYMSPSTQHSSERKLPSDRRESPSVASPELGGSSFSERLRDIILGESIAPGVFITFVNGHAEMHLKKTDAKSTFRDLRSARDKLARIIEEHGTITASTPSIDAARILVLALRKLGSSSEEAVTAIQELGAEIKGVNLSNPSNPQWSKELSMRIGDSLIDIKFKLKRNDFNISTVVSSDLSAESKRNKYSFQVSIERSLAREESMPGIFRSAKFRKACEWGGRAIPVGVCLAGYLGSSMQAAITSAVGGIFEPVVATAVIIGAVEYAHRTIRTRHYLQK